MTTDAEQIERFRTFLRIVSDGPRTDDGRYLVSPETLAYARGEDVDPVPYTQPERTQP